ncbi:unnamed protein product [marine sediment metagenome]|uniref:Uncharacterized protein n=1 Tax=marine sediment metagenome TaxID=412755 RepID=X0SYC7_9ZZZZ
MSVKTAANKAKSIGNKVGSIVLPLATALPVFSPVINDVIAGGPRGFITHITSTAQAWRAPGWHTVEGYIDGPGGAAIVTSLLAKLAKWGVRAVGLSDEIGSGFYLLVDAVEDWGDGSSLGYAIRELVYPSGAGSGALSEFGAGGVSFGRMPAKGSPKEMATKDQKPKARLTWA